MARDEAYRNAEEQIEEALRSGATELDLSNRGMDASTPQLTELPASLKQLTQLQSLILSYNQLTALPESLANLTQLQSLNLSSNQLTTLPNSLANLTQLQSVDLSHNPFTMLPDCLKSLTHLRSLRVMDTLIMSLPGWLRQLKELEMLYLDGIPLMVMPDWLNALTGLTYVSCTNTKLKLAPEWLCQLTKLKALFLDKNELNDLPSSLSGLEHLTRLYLDGNPLNPELAAAVDQGIDAVKAYLRAKAAAQITLNEAKLILVGEGEVGKSCLLDALLDNPWSEHDSTHGIQIRQIKVSPADGNTELTLNAWDFGGQRVYRPTHQLFFSAPAVYLVIWKPREGPQQGFVKEWIQLVKRREPDAKILVVATHGGPQQRQPDIDRQELRDLFGAETVLDFFHVESKPDANGERRGIEELKRAIAGVAAALPEMGRPVPRRWQEVREALEQTEEAYLPLERVFDLCGSRGMEDEEARLFVTIEHRLGHLIHYEHDPALRDIVVLKPDWLATAISFVLDDEATRSAHGLVRLSHLSQLWNDPARDAAFRYPEALHPIFLRLMARFDLSYRVSGLSPNDDSDPASLIAQLVPDTRPENDLERQWASDTEAGDIQQVQTCLIVDEKGQSATAEGLFYQLIVRLHKYSLGRLRYRDSVHWQRGLVLDDDYNGRALMEYVGNDMRITVRAAYPERFLAMLTGEVKYLVESFWEGLRCNVMVPCIEPCGKHAPGTGLFDVHNLIDSKRKGRDEFPCKVCNEWQDIDLLLRNAPAARPVRVGELIGNLDVLREVRALRQLSIVHHGQTRGRFDNLDAGQKELLSKADASFTNLMQALTDEAREGPRLFSLAPVDRSNFNPKKWVRTRFRLTLWCEHSRLPLPGLNGKDDKHGVYEIELDREWFKKAAPFLKVVTGTLSVILPVASSSIKLALDETAYKAIEEQLDFGKSVIDASIGEGTKIGGWMGAAESTSLEHGEATRGQGAVLRQLHALLKVKDPGFGGLVRVMNKRQEFLWVHPQFEKEY